MTNTAIAERHKETCTPCQLLTWKKCQWPHIADAVRSTIGDNKDIGWCTTIENLIIKPFI